jgi:hypothetical protein
VAKYRVNPDRTADITDKEEQHPQEKSYSFRPRVYGLTIHGVYCRSRDHSGNSNGEKLGAARKSGTEGAGTLTITRKQAKAAPAMPRMEIPGSDLSAMILSI